MLKISKILAPIAVCSLASSLFAGPDWDEGAKDAGTTPSTAQTVAGSTNTQVTRVRGGTSATALVGTPDLVDLFVVKTGSNTSLFKLDMNMGAGGEPAWDARLTIFKKSIVNCGIVSTNFVTLAFPIATVIKDSVSSSWPILNGGSLVNGSSNQTLGSLLEPNSEYFVAVSGSNNLPTGINSNCSTTGSTKTLFLNTNGNGIYSIPTADAGYHLTGWTDPTNAATGAYGMSTNIYPLPASSCSAPLFVEGTIVEKNFDFNFAPAIVGVAFPCAPAFIPNRQFFFLWTASCLGPAEVSTCGLTGADTGIEVFEVNACNPDFCESSSIGCNDQCGTANASTVNFTAESGRQYLVRLTRLSGTQATGSIKFTCAPALSSRDINGDGLVDGADLALLISSWGTSGN